METPSFDKLAAEGVNFTNAYCQMPLCTPSRLCLLTGKEARRAGAWKNGSILDPELPTLPRALSEAGYETCLVGKMHLGGRNQMAGFQHRPYGDLTGGTGHQGQEVPDWFEGSKFRWRVDGVGHLNHPESLLQEQVVAQESISWIREHRNEKPDTPWFLCASFSRPHFPLTAPKRWFDRYWPSGVTPPMAPAAGDSFDHPMCVNMRAGFEVDNLSKEETMRMRAGYFACVSFLDEMIGDMLTRLDRSGELENTIIVYTSDHGEMAGEHGSWWKHSFHEASVRVPLMISLPEHRYGGQPGRRIDTPVGLIDLFPTLCGLAGVEIPHDLDGRDLSSAIRGESSLSPEPVFSDNLTARWGKGSEFRLVRFENYKYVCFRDGSELLFDLEKDPLEQRDLARRKGEARNDQILEELRALVDETMDFDATEREQSEWIARLAASYSLQNLSAQGNYYHMPDGSVSYADDLVYNPVSVAQSLEEICMPSSKKTLVEITEEA